MQAFLKFSNEYQALRKRARHAPSLEFTEAGLTLGAGTLIAVSRCGAGGKARCDFSGEDRIFALLAAACWQPVKAAVLGKLRRACCLWADGEKCLA